MDLINKLVKDLEGHEITKHEGNFSLLFWGTAPMLLYDPLLYKYYPKDFNFGSLAFLAGEKKGIGFFSQDSYSKCTRLTMEKYLNSPKDFIEFKDYQVLLDEINQAYQELTPDKLKKLSNQELIAEAKEMLDKVIDWQVTALFCEALDEPIVKDFYLKLGGKEKDFKEFMEHLSLVDFTTMVAQIQKMLLDRDKYTGYEMQYMFASYLSAPLLEEIPEVVSQTIEEYGGLEKIKTDLAEFDQTIKKNKGKSDVYRKTLSDQLKELYDFSKKSIEIRDTRKPFIFKRITITANIMYELLSRLGVPKEDNIYLYYQDLEDGSIKKDNYQKILNKRKKGFMVFYFADGMKTEYVDYNQAKEKMFAAIGRDQETQEVKGMVASKGKVQGRVRVILEIKEVSSFEEGESLVTSMTRPEFVPVIKKSAAIVTDEGGISCHAAIVSRELNKPCIIGTKNATRVLKDGMEVEVDAEKGVVKIIE